MERFCLANSLFVEVIEEGEASHCFHGEMKEQACSRRLYGGGLSTRFPNWDPNGSLKPTVEAMPLGPDDGEAKIHRNFQLYGSPANIDDVIHLHGSPANIQDDIHL